jgi:hypothetical protein
LDGEATKRHKDTLGAFGLRDEDLAAWRESGLPDEAFVEWLVDRVARRPPARGRGRCTEPRTYTTSRAARSSTR